VRIAAGGRSSVIIRPPPNKTIQGGRFHAAGGRGSVSSRTSPSRTSQGGPHFNGVVDLHAALERTSDLSNSRNLPDSADKLGTCFTLKEVVTSGILTKKQALECQSAVGESSEKAALEENQQAAKPELDHMMSIWDLCELVSSPSFSFCDAHSPAADLSSATSLASSALAYWDAVQRPDGLYREEEVHEDSALGKHQEATDTGSPAPSMSHPPSSAMPGCVGHHGDPNSHFPRTRRPELVIEGSWELGKCNGADSAQNPQVQLQAERLTWMSVELLAEGPCGPIMQLWVLKNCRWGLRRPKLVHVLAHASITGKPHGPRRIKCECELPADEVISIVVACDGGNDEHGKNRRIVKQQTMTLSGWEKDNKLAAIHAASAVRTPSKTGGVEQAIVLGPTFRLTIGTSQPLARGPVLLTQRQKQVREQSPLATSETAGARSFWPSGQLCRRCAGRCAGDVLCLATSETAAGRCAASCCWPYNVGSERFAPHVQIDPRKIPMFAETIMHAEKAIEEKVAKGLEEASASCCRHARLSYNMNDGADDGNHPIKLCAEFAHKCQESHLSRNVTFEQSEPLRKSIVRPKLRDQMSLFFHRSQTLKTDNTSE